ncbi:ORF4 [nege-like virus 1]|nr:ORF4 [nege-like virus 1]
MALVPERIARKRREDSSVPKFYDEDGIVTVRGGQTINDNIVNAMFLAVCNITMHIWALIFLLISICIMLADYLKLDGPFDIAGKILKEEAGNYTGVLSSMLGMSATLCVKISRHQVRLAWVLLLSVPYLCKPSSRNTVAFLFLLLLSYLKVINHTEVILFTTLAYFAFMLRNPSHKFLMYFLLSLLFVFSLLNYKGDFLSKVISTVQPQGQSSGPVVSSPSGKPQGG